MKKNFTIYRIVTRTVKLGGDVSFGWNERIENVEVLEMVCDGFSCLEDAEKQLQETIQNNDRHHNSKFTILSEYTYDKH